MDHKELEILHLLEGNARLDIETIAKMTALTIDEVEQVIQSWKMRISF